MSLSTSEDDLKFSTAPQQTEEEPQASSSSSNEYVVVKSEVDHSRAAARSVEVVGEEFGCFTSLRERLKDFQVQIFTMSTS